jgi:hypothetical protein
LTQEKLPLGEAVGPRNHWTTGYQKAAAGAVVNQHRTTCVSKRVAYFEVEQLGLSAVDRTGSLSTHTHTHTGRQTAKELNVSKIAKLSLADMKALLPPQPVLATESMEQFEKIFDQVAIRLNVKDIVELIQVRAFVTASWDEARYTRHRAVAFDRKFKETLEKQVEHLESKQARREALSRALAEHLGPGPAQARYLVHLEERVCDAHTEIEDLLKRTPTELAYNKALERSIVFHKDLEFLITSISNRRNEALEMLERYRQGLGKRAEQIMEEILDAEYSQAETPAIENQVPQIAPPLAASTAPEADNQQVVTSPATVETAQPEPATASVSTDENADDGQD